jgi:hypothetical protein
MAAKRERRKIRRSHAHDLIVAPILKSKDRELADEMRKTTGWAHRIRKGGRYMAWPDIDVLLKRRGLRVIVVEDERGGKIVSSGDQAERMCIAYDRVRAVINLLHKFPGGPDRVGLPRPLSAMTSDATDEEILNWLVEASGIARYFRFIDDESTKL